jgi:hypothetical protein
MSEFEVRSLAGKLRFLARSRDAETLLRNFIQILILSSIIAPFLICKTKEPFYFRYPKVLYRRRMSIPRVGCRPVGT